MNHEIAKLFESDLNRRKINFSVGDTVKVHYKIVESGKERTSRKLKSLDPEILIE